MTSTVDRAGRPIFFPPWLETDEAGVIRAIPASHLPAIAAEVAPDRLIPFIRTLINATGRRKREVRWSAVNRQRLALAKLCIDRALIELSSGVAEG